MADDAPWSDTIRFAEVARSPVHRRLQADEAARRRIARSLGLDSLGRLEAELTLTPWLDGVDVAGRWSADTTQLCSLSGEEFDAPLEGVFQVRVLPPSSPNVPVETGEVTIDVEGEDPPDVAGSEVIDLAAYVVEHLALEIDPFPRKPGAVFEPPQEPHPPSPFDVLRDFKPARGGG